MAFANLRMDDEITAKALSNALSKLKRLHAGRKIHIGNEAQNLAQALDTDSALITVPNAQRLHVLFGKKHVYRWHRCIAKVDRETDPIHMDRDAAFNALCNQPSFDLISIEDQATCTSMAFCMLVHICTNWVRHTKPFVLVQMKTGALYRYPRDYQRGGLAPCRVRGSLPRKRGPLRAARCAHTYRAAVHVQVAPGLGITERGDSKPCGSVLRTEGRGGHSGPPTWRGARVARGATWGYAPPYPQPAESAQGLHAGPRFVSRKGGRQGRAPSGPGCASQRTADQRQQQHHEADGIEQPPRALGARPWSANIRPTSADDMNTAPMQTEVKEITTPPPAYAPGP